MRLVLDAGGLSALAGDRKRVQGVRLRVRSPPVVPSVVLSEVLTGDHRRDVGVNRYLKTCIVLAVDKSRAREAARLRTATGRAGEISAVDALVAVLAGERPGSFVATSDPAGLRALSAQSRFAFTVVVF